VAAAGYAAEKGAMKHTFRYSARDIANAITRIAIRDPRTPEGDYDPVVEFSYDDAKKEIFAIVTLTLAEEERPKDDDRLN
jgi:hypothetical protein